MTKMVRWGCGSVMLLACLPAPAAAQYMPDPNRPAGVRLIGPRGPVGTMRAPVDPADRAVPIRLASPATPTTTGPRPAFRWNGTTGTPQPLDPRGCELHVWGGERMQASSSGLLGNMGFSAIGLVGSLVDGLIHADDEQRDRQHMGDTLATTGQVAALGSLDVAGLVGLHGYRIIGHDEPMYPSVANRDRRRHAQSASPCYAELMVTRVVYDRTVAQRTLRVSFLFRDFGDAQQPRFTYAGRGGNPMRIVRGRDQSLAASGEAELVSVFQANFREYARNLTYQRTRG